MNEYEIRQEMGVQKWTGVTQVVFGLGLTALFFYMMAPFLVAILMGAVIAILCYPIHQKLKRKVPRWFSGLLVTIGVTLGILVPLGFVFVNGAYQLLGVLSKVHFTRDGQVGVSTVRPLVNQAFAGFLRMVPVNRSWLMGQAADVASAVVEKTTALLGAFLAGLPSLLLALAVVIISTYFLTVDGSRFLRFLSTLSPMRSERSNLLYETFQRSCRGVVLGLLASSLAQGLLITLFFLFLGVPDALLWGIFGVVMGMVPIVGTAPITIGAVLYLFSVDSPGLAIVMMVGVGMIGTADNIIRTWVLKGQSEMHPLLALVSAFGAINLFGPTGIFLGPIIAAVFVSFLKILSMEIRREAFPLSAAGLTGPSSTPPVAE